MPPTAVPVGGVLVNTGAVSAGPAADTPSVKSGRVLSFSWMVTVVPVTEAPGSRMPSAGSALPRSIR